MKNNARVSAILGAAMTLIVVSCGDRTGLPSMPGVPGREMSGNTSDAIVQYAIPDCPNAYCQPIGITRGPDGQMWFATYLDGVPGEVSSNGTFTQFQLSTADSLYDIATGPDGNLWMSAFGQPSQIVKLTVSGTPTYYSIPWKDAKPIGIAAGSDGNVWFCDEGAHAIGRVTSTGTFTRFKVGPRAQPQNIALGPDGNLWFTDLVETRENTIVSKIGTITTSGAVREFAIYNGEHFVNGITNGPDGRLWFTAGNHIGRITTTGQWQDYALPNPSEQAIDIATGPDGNVWITEPGEIVRSNGRHPHWMKRYFVRGGNPWYIAAGADGNMWFTVPGNGTIGVVGLH